MKPPGHVSYKRPRVGSGFESQRGKLQVSSMFACNYILHADSHGVSVFSVSYVPIKIKISQIVILHYHVEMLSALPNLTVYFLSA